MEATTMSPASHDTIRLAPASGHAPRRLVILLHGVGSSGADMATLGQMWRERFPDTAFVAPDGTEPFDLGANGRQWFSVAGVTEGNRLPRVEAALGALLDFVEAERSRAGVAPAEMVLVGFSQGSIMALHLAMAFPDRCGAVLAYAGRIATPVPTPGEARPPVLMIGGEQDAIMSPSVVRASAAHLRAAGFPVEEHVLPGLTHTISAAGEQLGRAFLERVLHGA